MLEPPSAPAVGALRERVRTSLDDLAVHRWRVAGATLLVAVVAVIWLLSRVTGVGAQGPPAEKTLPRASSTVVSQPLTPGSSAPPASAVVYAAGAVVSPGIYRVAADARVADVVDAAGGAADDADFDRVNLAAKVTDGQRVYIARKGQPAPAVDAGSTEDGGESQIVDINTATAKQLEELPGVGPSTAQAIVAYRTQHGAFRSVQDLGNVKGIGPSKLAQLRDRARV